MAISQRRNHYEKIMSIILSALMLICSSTITNASGRASIGAASPYSYSDYSSYNQNDSYISEITLNYSGLTIGSIEVTHDELIVDDVTDSYPYLMLVLEKPGVDLDNYEETVVVKNNRARFDISELTPGLYNLFLYHNASYNGMFGSVINGEIELSIDENEKYLIQHPVYDENCAIKNTEVLCDEALEYFLKPSERMESDDPLIIETATLVASSCRTPYQKAIAIHDYVASEIFYNWDVISGKAEYGAQSAKTVLSSKTAVCEGYSSLLVAMARAVGIPARKVRGVAFDDYYSDSPFLQDSNHTWAELWVDGRWLIVDVTWDSNNRYENGVFARGDVSHLFFDMSMECLSLQHLITQAQLYNNLYLYIGYPKFHKNGGDWIDCECGVSPILINSRTFIPLRAVIESMGGNVDFYPDGSYDKIHCYLNGHDIQMWIDYGTYYVDGVAYYFETPPQIVNDRTMVPLRSIFEQAGCTVTYDEFADNWHGRVTIGYVD